ncbi:MAG: lamin tail domain-containing protein [Verrucomicrobiae bacterium]|nr:lamin tail domain-containing protein [Verrucomicrobiae bacterium]
MQIPFRLFDSSTAKKWFVILQVMAFTVFSRNEAGAVDSIVVLNELHYNPAATEETQEFVELYNQNVVNVDISGWSLDGGVDFTFAEGTVIDGNGYIVIAADVAAFSEAHPGKTALGPYTGNLGNGGDTVILRNNSGRIMDEITYGDRYPWPVAADGSGATLAKIDGLTVSEFPENWRASSEHGGTPGAFNFEEPWAPGEEPVEVPDGVAHYFTFDDNSEVDATDSSFSFTRSGAGFSSLVPQEPATGDAMRFDGSNDYVQIDESAPLTGYSLSMWVRADVIRAQSIMLMTNAGGATTAWSHQLRMTADGRFEHYTFDGAGKTVTGTTVAQPDIWYHIAVTATNGGQMFLFVDGVAEGTPVAVGSLWNQGSRWRAGEESGDGFAFYDGRIDELAIWHFAIKPEQAAALAAWTPPTEVSRSPAGGGGIPQTPPALAISELAPTNAANGEFWIELVNYGTKSISLGGCEIVSSGGDAIAIGAQSLGAGKFLVLDEATLGFRPDKQDVLFLYSPGQTFVLDGIAAKETKFQARLADAPTGEALVPSAPTPGEANTFEFNDAVVINEIMYSHRPIYGTPSTPDTLTSAPVFGFDAEWRSDQSGQDFGTAWREVGFDDASWPAGPGLHGRESADLGEPIRTDFVTSPPIATYYLRRTFQYNGAETKGLRLSMFVDDGAVIYLNGTEIYRINMADGEPAFDTLASDGVSNAELVEVSIPDVGLAAGQNTLAVELHQDRLGSSDVVFGMTLDAIVVDAPGVQGIEYQPIDEEWVELYNRSDSAVDLSGWKLDQAVEFEIPTGTVLAPGGYLVIANDAAALALKHPGVTVIGDFNGGLSNGEDHLILREANGNPVDDVRYYDGDPWPAYTDKGGSSLELINPFADNSSPDAWAASDNAANSDWKTYTFTAPAVRPRWYPTSSQRKFQELRLGLLDEGEVLVDDVTVTADPLGQATPLIQNGSMADGDDHWRFLGTHMTSHVENDGTNPALRIVATGPLNYMNNIVETSLKEEGETRLHAVDLGTEYQISLRAKWLHGSPQLHAELYYNQVTTTFILDQPQSHGTPGARNSTYRENSAPTYLHLSHSPVVPDANEDVTVSVDIDDPDGIASATLYYRLDGDTPFLSRTMSHGADGRWQGIIPGQSARRIVHFYVEAFDGAAPAQSSYAPAHGPESRALIKWQDGGAEETHQNLRLIMLTDEANDMHRSDQPEILFNRRLGLTIVYNEKDVAYDGGIRLRGSMFSRNSSSSSAVNIKFPADKKFRGLHKTISSRRTNRREILVKHMVSHAGGIHDSMNDIINQIGHINAQDGISRIEMTRFGSNFTGSLPDPDERGGTVFKMEGIRDIQNAVGGDAEGEKTPFPVGWISNFDLGDQGTDKEIYRHNIRINSNQHIDDYSEMIAMLQAFDLRGEDLDEAIPKVINVDRWMRKFGMMALCGIGDVYSQGNPHNFNMYVNPATGLVEPMPWDWDFTFNGGTNSALWGGSNIGTIIRRPIFNRIYLGHLKDMIESTFNSDYMDSWLTHYGDVSKESYRGNLSYIRSRASYVLGRLPDEIPFAITTNGGNAMEVDDSAVTLEGKGWINVHTMHVNGSTEPAELTWLDDENWKLTVPLQGGENDVTLTALNYRGAEVGTAAIKITNTGAVQGATAETFAITEIMYHPASDAALEFIELMNYSAGAIDLSGVTFSRGISFEFPSMELAAGKRVLIVQDRSAFEAAYGAGLLIAGEFQNGSRLANGGERITVLNAAGAVIADIDFQDSEPWPVAADGSGSSLEVLIPGATPGEAANWTASTTPGGSPGIGSNAGIPFTGDPNIDTDGDGLTAFVEYALGTSDDQRNDGSVLQARVSQEGNQPRLLVTFSRSSSAIDAVVAVETSANLSDWLPGTDSFTLDSSTINGGLVSETWSSEATSARFVRLKISPR